MENALYIYNTLSRKKELFKSLHPKLVGMYVCGPTVYSDAHLGHARPAITFDLIYRYLQHIGYKVRYVRNITDVGHLENDADEGEDKIEKQARLEHLEPMEIAQHFTNRYHINMIQLNTLPPSIEPHASGHIIEQIDMIKKILKAGYAYEVNGSVYFDITKYSKKYNYSKLSGRKAEELISNTRELEGQVEKRNPADFALWKKAKPGHIMRWHSSWSDGFPGWHLECSAMGTKYLGEHFDIHGGGMDIMFPHHESEIAQSVACNGKEPVKYWIHNNMVTIYGMKMTKSLDNFITLDQLFDGTHIDLYQAYSPMTIRFYILQAHYRSTLDFSNGALKAAEKGLKRLMQSYDMLLKIEVNAIKGISNLEVLENLKAIQNNCYDAMNDDFNSPVVIANLFEASRIINSVYDNMEGISEEDLELLKKIFNDFVFEILGLKKEDKKGNDELTNELMDIILMIRKNVRGIKDFETSDKIRDELNKFNIIIKDSKEGSSWKMN